MTDDRTTPGLRDELMTAGLSELLDSSDLSLDDLEESAAVERLARHLLATARRLELPGNASSRAEKLALLTARTNAAIIALGQAGDAVKVPPQLLRGVSHHGAAPGLAPLPPQPSIPLSASELLVNARGEPGLGTVLREEIDCAVDVDLVCAFVGWTGVRQLLENLQRLRGRGGRIRVVTSTYLGATSARAVDELTAIGAEVRIRYDGSATKLHAKSWLFERPSGLDTAYVGSSNLSQAALHDGIEWNVRLANADAPGVLRRMRAAFETYWNDPAYELFVPEHRARLEEALARARGADGRRHDARSQRAIGELEERLAEAYAELAMTPRHHQVRILEQLDARREQLDSHRNLVVAATGTGKTVIAAFDYSRLAARSGSAGHRPSLLFLAHRETILRQARNTFRQVLGDPDFGSLLGGENAVRPGERHVFAMVQTLDNRVDSLDPTAFDVVYVDEAHHAAADSYERIIDHLQPRELVGLTATPERSDGQPIAQLFGGAFTAELRLWEAIDDQLLVPFQYVGADDGTDLRDLSWHRGEYAIGDLSDLYTGDHGRVRRVVDVVHRWVDEPSRMRALGFCVSTKHAQFMAEQFTRLGFGADYLVGEHGEEHRELVLSRLRRGELQVVFSVEVLGEGVDVPDVDTLLLLRPTQSQVLFAQQLGRGLRQAPGKSSCLVLDFIGQHRAEYKTADRFRALVDISRGPLRRQAEQGFPFLPAGCDITFEEVARQRVLAALQQGASGELRRMQADLVHGRHADLAAFLEQTDRSVEQVYAPYARKMSWTDLRRRAATDSPGMTAPGADAAPEEEAELLQRVGFLVHVRDPLRVGTWRSWLTGDGPPDPALMTERERRLAVQLFRLLNHAPSNLDAGFARLWEHDAVRTEIVELLGITGQLLDHATAGLPGMPDVPLLAHARYTRAEALAAMDIGSIDRPRVHQAGVEFDHMSRTQLVFVTLAKDARDYAPSIQYQDYAVSRDLFHWQTPNSWRQDSPAMQRCIGAAGDGSTNRLLFVREQRTGAVEQTFRLVGQVDIDGPLRGDRPVSLTWRLRQPLPETSYAALSVLTAS